MLSTTTALIYLIGFAALFTFVGMVFTRRYKDDLEQLISARNSQNTISTTLTLLATSLGAWILFAPAQAASWGGLAAISGYALGALAPRLVMVLLGKRVRELIPKGHTLSEYILKRYGLPMYGLSLAIMLLTLFITIAAEITAIGKLIQLIAPVPLYLSAIVVMIATLLYTSYGGLRATILTDKLQMLIIAPLLIALLFFGWKSTGGISTLLTQVQSQAPQLLQWSDANGLKAGATFFLAILLTGLFHQANWQRVYAAQNTPSMQRSFILAGILAAPIIFLLGLFGLAFAIQSPGGDASTAVFNIVLPYLPAWLLIALIPLGLSLVMSTTDSALNAVSSLIAIDIHRLYPHASPERIMAWSRYLLLPLAVVVVLIAAQGYSVLYLFLLADLFCCAAAIPVFLGLFNSYYSGKAALTSILGGLIAGLLFFPAPGENPDYLLESFLMAIGVPILISAISLVGRRHAPRFDYAVLTQSIKQLND